MQFPCSTSPQKVGFLIDQKRKRKRKKKKIGFLMVPKRHFREVGGEEFKFPVPESKRRPLFKKWVVLV